MYKFKSLMVAILYLTGMTVGVRVCDRKLSRPNHNCPQQDRTLEVVFRHDEYINRYYRCISGAAYEFQCPPEKFFDPLKGRCGCSSEIEAKSWETKRLVPSSKCVEGVKFVELGSYLPQYLQCVSEGVAELKTCPVGQSKTRTVQLLWVADHCEGFVTTRGHELNCEGEESYKPKSGTDNCKQSEMKQYDLTKHDGYRPFFQVSPQEKVDLVNQFSDFQYKDQKPSDIDEPRKGMSNRHKDSGYDDDVSYQPYQCDEEDHDDHDHKGKTSKGKKILRKDGDHSEDVSYQMFQRHKKPGMIGSPPLSLLSGVFRTTTTTAEPCTATVPCTTTPEPCATTPEPCATTPEPCEPTTTTPEPCETTTTTPEPCETTTPEPCETTTTTTEPCTTTTTTTEPCTTTTTTPEPTTTTTTTPEPTTTTPEPTTEEEVFEMEWHDQHLVRQTTTTPEEYETTCICFRVEKTPSDESRDKRDALVTATESLRTTTTSPALLANRSTPASKEAAIVAKDVTDSSRTDLPSTTTDGTASVVSNIRRMRLKLIQKITMD